MFFAATPYRAASFSAFSRWPLTKATTFDRSHFAKAGRIWLMLSDPRPTIAQPSLGPGGSGTRSCAAAVRAASGDTARPALAALRNPRRDTEEAVRLGMRGMIADPGSYFRTSKSTHCDARRSTRPLRWRE